MIVLALLAMAVLYIWLVPTMVGTRMRRGVNYDRRRKTRRRKASPVQVYLDEHAFAKRKARRSRDKK